MAETQTRWTVENVIVSLYQKSATDKYRPPSKGGNTRAWHTHSLTINRERDSFRALGARQWVYSGDTVSMRRHAKISKDYQRDDYH